ncbi:MAG: UTP--glucose-1-phosphate uridylyltransferase GalU [Pseudomonadota bacterium]|nr:UTP--glucose-1-phosphate uridylyltransferase GalU [Pseudomonadota bacterium]
MRVARPRVRKAVFPVAGLGTRFLPATKACPKELLPIVDKPLIQYAVEEAAAAGITEMIFVTGRTKRAIEDHFDKAYELESELARAGKRAILAELQSFIPRGLSFSYVRQTQPLGLGHAVLCARPLVGTEPFAVILPDDLIDSPVPVMKSMVELYEQHGASVIAVQDVDRSLVQQYGVIKPGASRGETTSIVDLVEKPRAEDAPSTLAVVGRYVLSAAVFDHVAGAADAATGEIQLTDALRRLLATDEVLAYEFEGDRYDCGSKLGYLKAQVCFGRNHPDFGNEFTTWLELQQGHEVARSREPALAGAQRG